MTHHRKSISIVVGAQMCACIFAGGIVLTHFHRHSPAHLSSGSSNYEDIAAHPIHSAPPGTSQLYHMPDRAHYQEPQITLRQAAIAVPMVDAGPGAYGEPYTKIGHWRIVNMRGHTIASGKIPSDLNGSSSDGGFTIGNTKRILPISNLPTAVLSIQANPGAAKLAGGEYALEQADCGRLTHTCFRVVAPPTTRVATSRF